MIKVFLKSVYGFKIIGNEMCRVLNGKFFKKYYLLIWEIYKEIISERFFNLWENF